MSEEEDRHTLSIQLANQIINTANNRLQEGMDPVDVAAGMRHAAANFTAFAIANSEAPCLLYTSPSPRDGLLSRMPSSA